MTRIAEKLAAFLRPIAEVRPGEQFKTAVMFLYFFLTIALIYILKPVRGALFLEELGAQNLRYVYMGEGIFLMLVAAAYMQLSKRLSKKIFFTSTLVFFATNLVLFWFFFRAKTPYLSAIFYIWVASFSITSTTQFWILANDIFDPAEAKRLFGLIISGGSAGGVVGGLLTHQAMRWLRVEDMLWVAAGVLLFCVVLLQIFWNRIYQKKTAAPAEKKQARLRSGRRLLMGSSYLMMLALLVMTAKMSSTIIDNQFNRIVELSIAGKEARAAFFGVFMAWLNGISFIAQLICTGVCLRFLGVGFSLWILPVGLGLFSFGSIVYPVLGAALFLKIFDGSVNYSIQQASKEVLFLPLTSKLRYRVKPLIDMLGFRVAKSLSGVYIAIAAPLLHLADERLGMLVLFLIPGWLILVWRMRKAYSRLLRGHVLSQPRPPRRSRKKPDILECLQSEKAYRSIQNFLKVPSAYARKVAASALLFDAHAGPRRRSGRKILEKIVLEEGDEKLHSRPILGMGFREQTLLEQLARGDMKLSDEDFSNDLDGSSGDLLTKLGVLLSNSGQSLKIRRGAVRILEQIGKQPCADLLLSSLGSIEIESLRYSILKALCRMQDKNPKIILNRPRIKEEILNEVKIHKLLQKLLGFCRESVLPRQDYFAILLEAYLEENLERLFLFLNLLYPHEVINDIYFGIIKNPEGHPVRTHATELLINTLEPDLLAVISGILESKPEKISEEEALETLQHLRSIKEGWVSLIGHFLKMVVKRDAFAEKSSMAEEKNTPQPVFLYNARK